ncbi:outer membrane protein assembly factor BamB family protein [Sphingomonas qomolangmaensis]|uniref:PQQ-binding-like beta-propeller repeat protein n=1 Tax=Sphingomonas qomolangmaensis TaxID=2918765 RepID=A0ABY5LB86_9SPHN|nr:PQQ-binding-like beta-propeller repeat protein [Sphingomonas qomolangmaensis]UUL83132.1 PQQ-binding-like beta-propeller repeat protein [Sphingomonas qomolangmaensis]
MALAALPALAQQKGDWASYGRDEGHARHSPLTAIKPANVSKLKKLWSYHMRPAGVTADSIPMPDGVPERFKTGFSASEATPLVVDGTMYLSTPYRRVVALDAATGKERWVFNFPGNDQASTRGVAYWPGDGKTGARIVFGTRTGKLYALDAKTGQPAAGFGEAGAVNMKTPEVMNGTRAPLGMSSPPAVYKNLIITGSRVQEMPAKGAAGDVRAWDAVTGKLAWTFHTIPQPGEANFGTWEGDSWKGRSGNNVWTFVVVDDQRGIAYLPVGAPTFDRWGGDRKGMNLYGNSIVAVEAATGKYLWHFQTMHHDIWDVDLPAATLIDVKRDGKTIPAIAVMNKTAIMFILDRVTGKPLYDVKEVPVPTDTDVPGEQPWPTQPMPAKPAPLSRLTFSMDEMVTAPASLRATCDKIVADMGVVASKAFQPLRADSAVAFFPGSFGGIDWGGGSFDPATGLYVVNINNLASPQQMEKQPDGSWGLKGGYAYFLDPETGNPCSKPPWGELVAVNVNSGDIVWRSVLGANEDPALKDAGGISAGGPITTASGLTFIGATRDSMIRAFETRTGKLLWSDKLPASNYGTPMTFAMKDGRQAVGVVATGGFAFQAATADEVVVYTLP